MGIDLNYLPLLMIAITIVALIYTALGGIQAVMITDVLQTLLLLVGGVAVILIVSLEGHGFSWFPTRWQPEIWDSQPIFSANLSTRVTFFGTVLTTFIWYLATQIGDQVAVQRFMASKDIYSARAALAINLCLSGLVAIILTLAGFSLLGHFQINPSELRDGLSLERDADQIFPYFISFHLPPLVSGLVLCGLFSAAMSSIDSGVNSISAVVLTDFIKRLKGAFPAKMSLSYARWISAAVGVAVVLFGNLIELVPGNIMEVTNKTVNLLTIPIFIVVAYSIFLRAYNASSVLIGTLSSIVAGVLCAFSGAIFGYDSKTGLDPISFQYIGPISLVVGLIFTHGSGVLFRLACKST
jgi:SSS family solute:Na+ symporter